MPKKSEYWQKRFDQIEQRANNQSVDYINQLEQKYREAAQQIDRQINAWYQRLANNNGVSMTEVKRLLNDSELAEFKWSVEQYIQYGRENAIDQRWMKELENASAKFHINRLEALKIEVRQQIEVATGGMVDDVDALLKRVYSDTFYRSCFETQKGIGIGFDVSKLDDGKVSKLLSKPWSVDGTNFSEKLWGNKRKLINTLDQELSRMVLTGESPRTAIANIKKAMDSSQFAAKRLVFTEQAYFTSLAQKDSYGELDVEEFEFVGTLDSRTCGDCGDLDGKHFPISEMAIGVNAPPMHPFCRCTTCPYFGDEFTIGGRIAKDADGEYYEVPEKMTYKEWKETFVDGHVLNDSTDKWAKEAKEELVLSEKSLAARKKEVAEIYSADGKYLFTKRGSVDEISFTSKEFRRLKGAVITHNHPTGGSFSPNDIWLLKKSKAAEIRAITENGVYFIRQPQKWSTEINSLAKIKSVREEIKKDVVKKYGKLYNQGVITKIERFRLSSDELNRRFAERYGFEYGKEVFED